MPNDLTKFWNDLVSVGVAADGDPPPQGFSSATELAKTLIARQKLTRWQAKQLLGDRAASICLGDWNRTGQPAPSILKGWFIVTPTPRCSSDVLQQIQQHLSVLRDAGPGNEPDANVVLLARRITSESAASGKILVGETLNARLQRYWSTTGEIALTALPVGRTLDESLINDSQPWTMEALIQFASAISVALADLHRLGRIHGQMQADHIWTRPNHSAILLWEPNPDGDQRWLSSSCDSDAHRAPELQDDPKPTKASDLYSLGCLLYQLRFGESPFQGNASELAVQHREVFPSTLQQAVDSPNRSRAFDRILAHLLAKNADARFTNCDHLVAAFAAASKLETVPEAKPKPAALLETEPRPASKPPIADKPIQQGRNPNETSVENDHPPVRQRRRQRSPIPVLAGMAAIPVLCFAIVLVLQATPSQQPNDTVVRRRPISTDNIPSVFGSSGPIDEVKSIVGNPGEITPTRVNIVADTSALWAAPLSTEESPVPQPIPLDLLPPGPGMLIHLRLQDRLLGPAGQSLVQALAPESVTLLRQLQQQLRTELKLLADVTLAFHPGRSGRPFMTIVATLRQPIPEDQFLQRQAVSAARTRSGATIFASDDIDAPAVYFQSTLDEADQKWVRRWASGPIDQVTEIAEREGEPILLPASMESLWEATNDRLAINLLMMPNFLFSDARQYIQSSAPNSEATLRQFFLAETNAVLLVADIDPNANYLEARVSPAGGIREQQLLSSLRQQIESLAAAADGLHQSSTVETSWQPLAQRLPSMLRFLASQVRYGVEDRRVIANAYLPPTGLAQLSLGGLLALNATPASAVSETVGTVAELSVGQMLDRTMSIAFDQESLESAAAAIRQEFNNDQPPDNPLPTIDLRGNDLRTLGITQNQQIRDFQFTDTPLRKVLTELVLAANPDRTATGPNDEKQVLVWATDAPTPTKILITTRPAAMQGLQLPTAFKIP